MKQKLFTLLLAVAASVGTTFAVNVKIGDLYYNLDATNQTAEVARNSSASGEIIIPSSVTYNSVSYSVTSIGEHAFNYCDGLTSVTIPNSVTSIGEWAFRDCSGLTSMTIPNSVTSIGIYAFYYCGGLTSITIPNSVTSIGNEAFSYCSSLTSVTIPNSVTSIGDRAFRDCTGLTSVTIPNSVTSIGRLAFYNCSGLTSVTIPYSVTSIGNEAFESCSSLTSVTIPNSVTSIGDAAFWGCSSLTSVTIPNSVTSIGRSAFWGCSSLTSPVYNAHVFAFMPNSYSGEYTIPEGIESIAGGAFWGCRGLTSVTIPNSVTCIGNDAFSGCSSLTSPVYNAHVFAYMPKSYSGAYTIPDGIESIAGAAFSGCGSLTSVMIPNSVTSIGKAAFYGCSSLTSVTIPNSVTCIGNDAFSGCSSLTSPVYNAHVFAFMPNSYSGEYTIPEGIESIAGGAFWGCRGLTSVTIPNSVTSIGERAFYGCSSLTSVTIEAETPPTIGIYCFYYEDDNRKYRPLNISIYVPCGSLDTYKTAEGWSDYASRIKYAPLPYKISTQAENGRVATTDVATLTICEPFVTCTATPDYGYHFTQWSDGNKENPRTFVLTQDTTFTAEFAIDRVGTCGKDLALVWSYDPNSKVLTIGNAGSFTENMQFGVEAPNEMEELVIGNSVTAIGANAFASISSLKKVSIGESVKTIGEQAFYNCVNLETIFNYRPTPTNAYSTAFDGVDKFECTLYVLPNSIDMYKAAAVWRDFYYTYAIGAEETTVTTNDVTVEPQDNAVTVTWPTSENAASYTIQITKDGVLFCTLIFNANGQLIGIAFAPSRDGQAHAPAAIMTANGLQFTVTGLNSNTQYGYSVTAKDANDQIVATYSGEFTTTGEGTATGIDNTNVGTRASKILHDGQIFILRGDKTYTLTGQEVR